MNFLHRISLPVCALLFANLACNLGAAPTGSTDPLPGSGFFLVTPKAQVSVTPFQPVLFTPSPAPSPVIPTPFPTITAPPTSTGAPPPTFAPPTPLATDTVAPAPQPVARPQYAINALLDYDNHTLAVSETILYPNHSNDALGSLLLGVNPMLWNNTFYLQSLSVNDQPWSDYSLSGQYLTINLPAPLQPGQAVKLGIGYNLLLPYSNGRYENFGYTVRQTTLIDWYPFVAPYLPGSGWVLPEPYPYGENLVYPEADFRVSLSFADPTNPPVVAASAPASVEDGTLVYVLSRARNFSIAASREFVLSTAAANPNSSGAGAVVIYNYAFPEDANAAAMVLELTRLAVNTYSEVFGPYPHASLTVVETDLNDGLETDGLYFLSSSFYRAYDGSVQNNLAVIAVHETAHQWWYGAVASNQAVEPWLDEGLSTYSEGVFYERNFPGLLNWWWNFRVNSRAPSGWVDSRLYDTGTFPAYVNAVYFNGANFLDALRLRIGDEAFFAFLKAYYARQRGGIANAGAFFAILDEHTDADYSDLLQTYFYYR